MAENNCASKGQVLLLVKLTWHFTRKSVLPPYEMAEAKP